MGGWRWGRAFSLVLATGFAWCSQSAADMNSTSTLHGDKYLCGERQQVNCTGLGVTGKAMFIAKDEQCCDAWGTQQARQHPWRKAGDPLTEAPLLKHFSKCPKRFEGYCIQGQCRFLVSEQQPSCICKSGYTGSRCEMVDMLYLIGDHDQFIIMGLVLAMVVLVTLIIIICICVHRYRRKCKGRRKWRLCVKAVSTQPVEERNVRGENEDTAMTTLA